MLDALTLANGYSYGYGGGIYLNSSQNTVIRDCLVRDCATVYGGRGGGIKVTNGLLEINNVTILRCQAEVAGGGVYFGAAGTLVRRLVVEGCSADKGGGIAVSGGNGDITDSTFRGNSAALYGGGVWLEGVWGTALEASFITGNSAPLGSAAAIGGGTTGRISNNIMSANVSESATVYIFGSGTQPGLYYNTIADNQATTGNSAVYVAEGADALFRGMCIAYNNGPLAAVGRHASGDYDWQFCSFWENENGMFDTPSDATEKGFKVRELNPGFLSRAHIDRATAYNLRPSSDVIDRGGNYEPCDHLDAPRPVNATGTEFDFSDGGAFEFRAVEQYIALQAWRGPLGDGDQSWALVHTLVFDGEGRLVCDVWLPQSPSGYYMLEGAQFPKGSGPYEIIFDAPGYLSSRINLASLPEWNCTGMNVTLLCGDATGDNAILATDLNLVLLALGSEGVAAGDLNGDHVVDAFDLNLVLLNFGQVGD